MQPDNVRRHLEQRSRGAATGRFELNRTAGTPAEAAVLASISASYFRLRRALAVLAFAFPIVLWLGAGVHDLQSSISAYYHFRHGLPAVQGYGAGTMRDVFVGVLWAIGSFLFFYKGYSWEEDIALNFAGAAAVLISLFPMDWPYGSALTTAGIVHYASAIVFFAAIAYVALARSKDTLEIIDNARTKSVFRRIYTGLGVLMAGVPPLIYGVHRLVDHGQPSINVWAIESVAIWVFAGFWLTKSRELAVIEKQLAAKSLPPL